MHTVDLRPEVIERAIQKRGRLHWFDSLDPKKTAMLVIDMQNVFVKPGAPAAVPAAPEIVDDINRTNAALRKLGCRIVWIVSVIRREPDGSSEWDMYYDYVLSPEVRESSLAWFQPDHEGVQIWSELEVEPVDAKIIKNRYSALVNGSSTLERYLRSHHIENVLIAGTRTNACCESTARDAMMLDFRTIMLSDCNAALTDDEHRATLENMILSFADVMTGDEAVSLLRGRPNFRQ